MSAAGLAVFGGLAGCRGGGGPLAALPGLGGRFDSQIVERGQYADPEPFVGEWEDHAGREFEVEPARGKTVRVSVEDEAGEREYPGVLFELFGTTFLELKLTDDRRLEPGAVPVFHYGRVELQDDGRLEHTPLDTKWLDTMVVGSEQIQQAMLPNGAMAVAVADPAAMRELLSSAIVEGAAWADSELLVREADDDEHGEAERDDSSEGDA